MIDLNVGVADKETSIVNKLDSDFFDHLTTWQFVEGVPVPIGSLIRPPGAIAKPLVARSASVAIAHWQSRTPRLDRTRYPTAMTMSSAWRCTEGCTLRAPSA